ncbi:MAG: hypothetical protein AAGG48_22315 [Planctomycetota bacterium]
MSHRTSDPARSQNKEAVQVQNLEEKQRRILELELVQVRKEAVVARLEARAAEIERLLHQDGLRSVVKRNRHDKEKKDAAEKTLESCPSSRQEISRPRTVTTSARASRTKEPPTPPVDDFAEASTDHQRRSSRRPALIISVLGHVFLIFVLGFVGLRLSPPKDQVAFTATAAASEPTSIETIRIENTIPTSATESESQENLDAELVPDPVLGQSSLIPPSLQTLGDDSSPSLLESTGAELLRGDESTGEKMEFFGVEGGGNHFVYLVDSSKSMGTAFESAREELVRSIQALQPDQRFYVVFFDADSDYMRIRDPNTNESMSLSATNENKAALTQWAKGISMDDGQAPYEPLRFALDLKPDVIFLLSDGEFPAGIEDLLTEDNYVENLFGDVQRISIVHTIGYHSQRGEERMRRIAERNGGQYHYVRKP